MAARPGERHTTRPSDQVGIVRVVTLLLPRPLSREKQDILQCLGGAVVAQWNKLPTAVQKALFEHAVSNADARESLDLREHIALFLHHHKNDRPGQA